MSKNKWEAFMEREKADAVAKGKQRRPEMRRLVRLIKEAFDDGEFRFVKKFADRLSGLAYDESWDKCLQKWPAVLATDSKRMKKKGQR